MRVVDAELVTKLNEPDKRASRAVGATVAETSPEIVTIGTLLTEAFQALHGRSPKTLIHRNPLEVMADHFEVYSRAHMPWYRAIWS